MKCPTLYTGSLKRYAAQTLWRSLMQLFNTIPFSGPMWLLCLQKPFQIRCNFSPPMHATGRLLYNFLGDLNRCHITIFSGVHISGCNIRATLWFYWFFSPYLNMNRYNNLNRWISAKFHCSEVRMPSQPFHSAYAFGSEPYCTRRKQTNKHHQALLPLLSKAVLNDSR